MKSKRKWIAALMSGMILSGSVLSYAANFTDMKDPKGKDHWSLPFVTDITSKGLVAGYSDGTFKPNKAVSRIESVVFISRMFPVETVKATFETNKAKWDEKLKANMIPDFARTAVVFGLENGWYTEAYLKEFINSKDKTQKDAQRYEFVVYLVRALGWDKEMSNAAVVSYKDTKNIPKQAVPYVEILGKKGVIATSGDFNPLKPVTRGEVAKMLSISYPSSPKAKGIQKTTTDPTAPVAPTQPGVVSMPSGTLVEGKMKQVTIDHQQNAIVLITDPRGEIRSFTNRLNGVIVSLDGKSADLLSIREGASVKLYTDGTTLKGIEATSISTVSKDTKGEIAGVTSGAIKIRSGSVTEEFSFASNVKILKDGKDARILDLKVGDDISAKVQNSLIVSAEAKTVRRTLKNVVIKGITSYSNGTANIIIADEQGNQFTMEFTTNSTAYMSNKKVGVSSIAVGYEADIYANSSEIMDITLYGEARGTVITGVITDTNLREDIIYVKRSDGKEVKVFIKRGAEVVDQITNTKKRIDDLAKNQNVIINGFEGSNSFEATRIAFY